MASVIDIVTTVIAVTVLVGLLVGLGWQLAVENLRYVRSGLQNQRDLLDAEWRALDDTRRIREVFLVARRAMQREADRQPPRGPAS